MNIPRIALRRFTGDVWNDILTHAPRLELEVENSGCLGTVQTLLRRYQALHAGAWFVVTIVTPTLLLVERRKEQPSNPVTGKPCAIRVNAATKVDEAGVVEELAQVATTFPEHLTRAAFRAFLREQFGAHVLRGDDGLARLRQHGGGEQGGQQRGGGEQARECHRRGGAQRAA